MLGMGDTSATVKKDCTFVQNEMINDTNQFSDRRSKSQTEKEILYNVMLKVSNLGDFQLQGL